MISFRLGVLGRSLLEVSFGEEPAPCEDAPAFTWTPYATATQSSGCFFADTASDVEYDEAMAEGVCPAGCTCDEEDEDDE